MLLYLLDGDRTRDRLAGAAGLQKSATDTPLVINFPDKTSTPQSWPFAEVIESEIMQIVENLPGKIFNGPESRSRGA